jgi:outer membrane immunogenic protein
LPELLVEFGAFIMGHVRGAAVAAVAVFGFASVASAADMPIKAPVNKAPVAVAVHNWTGFYVGANAGYAWSAGAANYTVDPFFAGAPIGTPAGDAGRAALAASSTHVSDRTFTGGVQAGYNLQFNNIVVGVEADFNSLRLNNSTDTAGSNGIGVPWIDNVHTSIKTDWLLTVRPRIGVASNSFLLYATGGLAVTRLDTFQSQSNNDVFGGGFFPGYSESVSGIMTKTGWTVGGGLEYAMSDHWTVKGEYLYTDFGNVTLTGTAGPPTDFGFGGQSFTHTFDLHSSMVRTGINYKF